MEADPPMEHRKVRCCDDFKCSSLNNATVLNENVRYQHLDDFLQIARFFNQWGGRGPAYCAVCERSSAMAPLPKAGHASIQPL